jgi:hypothetical protein
VSSIREQARDLAVVRQERVHRAREPQRLGHEVVALQVGADAARVALVEDQIEHVQHRAQAFLALALGGHGERHAGVLDLLLRAADALRHRRLGHEIRVRDLGRREPADGAQRKRDRGRRRQHRMAAHEEQQQRVVVLAGLGVLGRRRELRVGRLLPQHLGLAPAPRDLAAQLVGHAPRGDLDKPRPRVVGHALVGPLHRGGEQRFLHGVLGGREVAEAADHCAEHLRRELAQQVLVGLRRARRQTSPLVLLIITGWTSIGMSSGLPPGPGAADARAASSYARCGVSTSIIQ